MLQDEGLRDTRPENELASGGLVVDGQTLLGKEVADSEEDSDDLAQENLVAALHQSSQCRFVRKKQKSLTNSKLTRSSICTWSGSCR